MPKSAFGALVLSARGAGAGGKFECRIALLTRGLSGDQDGVGDEVGDPRPGVF